MTESDNQRRDRLADMLSAFVENWKLEDVISVCASIATAAIAMADDRPEQRRAALDSVHNFMRDVLESIEATGKTKQ